MSSVNFKKISIIIPVYNESKTITEVLKKVQAAPLPANWIKEIIVVDDGSTDGTRNILTGIKSESPSGQADKLIMSHRNGGKGAALKEGFQAATGDFILIQDADLEYDPSDYVKLLEPIIQGRSEVVFGSRTLGRNKVPLSRVFFYGGLLISKIFNFLFRSSISDVATCYKIFPQRYVSELLIQKSNDFVFDVIELSYVLLKKGPIVEVPISYDSRGSLEGKKMSWRHGWRCFRRMLSLAILRK